MAAFRLISNLPSFSFDTPFWSALSFVSSSLIVLSFWHQWCVCVCVNIWNAIKLKSYYLVLPSNVVFFLFFILQVQLFQRFSSELKPPFSLLRWIAVAVRTYEHWQPYEDSGFLLVAITMSHFDIIIK